VFSQRSVKDLLSRYARVQLYTDVVPVRYEPTTSAAENRQLMSEKFGNAQLPLYVILKPLPGETYQVVDVYNEGKINNVEGFIDFLQKPLAANTAKSRVLAAGPAKEGSAVP
jgi:hypothetical protein